MGMSVQFSELSAARAKLARLAQGLHRVASGDVIVSAVGKVQAFLDETARKKLRAHIATGEAIGSLAVTDSGSLVLLSASRYLRYHGWWPFRRGMPGFAVKQALRILAAEVLAAVGRDGDLGKLAGNVTDAANAADGKRLDRAAKKREEAADRKAVRDAKRKRDRESRKKARQ
jgi:hypothetical protein